MPRHALAILLACIAAPAAAPAVALADATEPVYPPYGEPRGQTFWVNPRVPAGVDAARFLSVAERSIVRWGDVYAGTTDAVPGEIDGRNVVGFSADLAPLQAGLHRGVETVRVTPARRACETVTRRVVRRRVRHRWVWVTRGGERVRVRRRVVVKRRVPVERLRCTDVPEQRETIAESDVLLNETMLWAAGPAYPVGDETDLESVLLHELGHAYGLGHSEPCTLMGTVLTGTDYWRSPTDFSWAWCTATAG